MQPRDDTGNRRLAAPGLSHEGYASTLLEGKRHVWAATSVLRRLWYSARRCRTSKTVVRGPSATELAARDARRDPLHSWRVLPLEAAHRVAAGNLLQTGQLFVASLHVLRATRREGAAVWALTHTYGDAGHRLQLPRPHVVRASKP